MCCVNNYVVLEKVHLGYLFLSVAMAITITHMFSTFVYNSVFLLCSTDAYLQSLPYSPPHPQIIYFLKRTESAIDSYQRFYRGELVFTTEGSAVLGLSRLLLQPRASPSLEIFPSMQCQAELLFSSFLLSSLLPCRSFSSILLTLAPPISSSL